MPILENKDKELAKYIKQKIEENGGYCLSTTQKTPDTKCICKKFHRQAEGLCNCGLYYKTQERATE